MKRIKDFSKVIGIVGRAGRFFPSNEKSQIKADHVTKLSMGCTIKDGFDRNGLRWFKGVAKECGYSIIVIERGLNR